MKWCINISVFCILTLAFFFAGCEDQKYEIDYQNGYPNKLAGNWIAVDYQLSRNNYFMVIDTINDFDLSNSQEFSRFASLLEITSASGDYDMATALDPNNAANLILNNLYNSGVRTRAGIIDKYIDVRLSEQLDLINHGGYGIAYVSVSGQLAEKTEGDVLYLIVGLFDNNKALFDAVIIEAFRKTGFEDTDYQSLLGK